MKNDNKQAGPGRQGPSNNVWQQQNQIYKPNNKYSPTLEMEQLDSIISEALAAPTAANGQAPQRAAAPGTSAGAQYNSTAPQNNPMVPTGNPAMALVNRTIPQQNRVATPNNRVASQENPVQAEFLPNIAPQGNGNTAPAAVNGQAPLHGGNSVSPAMMKAGVAAPQPSAAKPIQPQRATELTQEQSLYTEQEAKKEVAEELPQTEELVKGEEEQTGQQESKTEAKENRKSGPVFKKAVAVIVAFAVLGVSSLAGFLVHQKNAQKVQTASAPDTNITAKKVNVAKSLRTYTANKVKKQQSIPAYTFEQVQKLDLTKASGVTAADLKLVTRQGLVGLEEAFVNAEKKYGVNALFLIAIASLESANGTICFKPNNMFGYGSKGYDTKEDCIYDVASGLSGNYLNKKGPFYHGTTISAVHTRYAASSTWHTKVGNNMTNYYSIISAGRKKALKKL